MTGGPWRPEHKVSINRIRQSPAKKVTLEQNHETQSFIKQDNKNTGRD
jgi:hypothetical protein